MPDSRPRVCALLPSYNNAQTLAGVIRAVQAFLPDVLVVNDGSTDGAAEVLKGFPGIAVVTHPVNQGKGGALAGGFARAQELGFTHAVTIDTDGQHVLAALPAFLEAIARHPQALIIGVRDLAGAGRRRKSRLLRVNSNFWTWVETGRWLRDTQSGFRAYPLAAVRSLILTRRKYDYEIESLVKAMWAGVPVVELPVRVEYGPGSKSHFRPLRDFGLVARLNLSLVAQRLLMPGVLRRVVHQKAFRARPLRQSVPGLLGEAVAREYASPASFGAAVGVGVFFGIAPIWGFQMAAAAVAAHFLRLSKAVALIASNISIPVMIPFILYASLLLGRLVLTGHVDYALRVADLSLAVIGQCLVEYLVGSLLLALLAGALSGLLAYSLARAPDMLRKRPG